MNVFKLLICDTKEGIFKNKRFMSAPLISIFVCMSAHINIVFYKDMLDGTTAPTIFNLLLQSFRGCDPLSKIREMHAPIPYMWLAIFIFSLFTVFDYAYDDISNFGMQIISRTGNRVSWWYSKCLWAVLSGVYYYTLFIITSIIFTLFNEYNVSFRDNIILSDLLGNCSVYYTYKGAETVKGIDLLMFIISPLAVICTLNVLQMTISLIIKPIYSFFLSLGILLLSAFVDWVIAFPRTAMLPFTSHYQMNGYNMKIGLLICGIVLILSVMVGRIWFKRYDVLPSKNEV